LNSFIGQLQMAVDLVTAKVPLALSIIGLLWLILIFNALVGYRLNVLGIYPRHPLGLIGIFFHPFLHGSFNHLFFNSIPLFVLLTFMLIFGVGVFICASLCIIFLSGILIWLFGRKAIHIGASGLIMGYWSYLLVYAFRYPSILAYGLAIVCIYYFGSLLLSIFPNEERVSWEGHFFGLLAGIATSFICHQ
jgi:membrane associated rhomboid family serine protease